MVALHQRDRAQGRADHAPGRAAAAARLRCCGSRPVLLPPTRDASPSRGTSATGPRDACTASTNLACCRGGPSSAMSQFPLEIDGVWRRRARRPRPPLPRARGACPSRMNVRRNASSASASRAHRCANPSSSSWMSRAHAQTREQLQEDLLKIWFADGRDGRLRHPLHPRAPPLRSHLALNMRRRSAPSASPVAGERAGGDVRATRNRKYRTPRHAEVSHEPIHERKGRDAAQNPLLAPQPTLGKRVREVVTSPNAIFAPCRSYSSPSGTSWWRMDPIFMAPPSAVSAAALQSIQSGALKKARTSQPLRPFVVG